MNAPPPPDDMMPGPDSAHETVSVAGGSENPSKRRRILACERCRQVKVRCEFDQDSGDCKRCQRLRIECSLAQEMSNRRLEPSRTSSTAPAGGFDSLSKRLERQEYLLESLRSDVQSLSANLRGSRPPATAPRGSDHGRSDSYDAGSEGEWFDHPSQAPDAVTEMAPVNIMRRQNGNVGGGIRRLLDASDDVVVQGFLSEEQALHLEQIFLRCIGPWLQIDNWDGFGRNVPSIRERSSLLFAVCCVQGGRMDEEFNNTAKHIELYEYVRKSMQKLFLISPLPTDVCLAFLIMANWSTSPKDVSEYIDSWLLSGYTSQQEMLNLSFTRLVSSIRSGNATPLDRLRLRLWNSTCLCHLQFALGTGRPSTIARTYIDQARSIISSLEASAYDGYELAAISLFLASEDLLASSDIFPRFSHTQRILGRWKTQWEHLFDIQDPRLCCFRLTNNFCQLVIARRALEEHQAKRKKSTASLSSSIKQQQAQQINMATNLPMGMGGPGMPTVHSPSESTKFDVMDDAVLAREWGAMSRHNALQMLQTFGRVPLACARELPDFFYLCVTYAMMPSSDTTGEPVDQNAMLRVLQMALSHGQKSSYGRIRGFEYTIARLSEMLDGKDCSDGLPPGMENLPTANVNWNESWSLTPDLEAIFGEMVPDWFGGVDLAGGTMGH